MSQDLYQRARELVEIHEDDDRYHDELVEIWLFILNVLDAYAENLPKSEKECGA